jgi:hypothetical protein
MTPWLSQQEVNDLCEPLTQPAAQIRFLRDSLGLAVKPKPNGRALVLRSSVEEVLGGLPAKRKTKAAPAQRAPTQPNVQGLTLAYSQARR